MEQWLVIGISGVTCSGKTTLAQTLYNHFTSQAGTEVKTGLELNRVELINQDKYFRDVNDQNHQMIEKLNHLNWEILESINMENMIQDIMSILGGRFQLYNTRSSALMKNKRRENIFNDNYASNQSQFRNNANESNESNCKKVVKHNNSLNILIVEGFLIFNHAVTFDLCNVKFHLHVPYEICNARRKKRTYDPPDVPCYFEMVVWPAYEKHLRKFKDSEDVLFLNGDAAPEKCLQFVLKTLLDEL